MNKTYYQDDKMAKILAGNDFSGLDLSGQNFENKEYQDCRFDSSSISGANFVNTKLQNTNFSHVVGSSNNIFFNSTNFNDANLTNAVLNNAKLSHISFSRAILTDASINNSDLSYCNFSLATLNKTILNNSDCSNITFTDATIINVKAIDVTFTGSNMERWTAINCKPLKQKINICVKNSIQNSIYIDFCKDDIDVFTTYMKIPENDEEFDNNLKFKKFFNDKNPKFEGSKTDEEFKNFCIDNIKEFTAFYTKDNSGKQFEEFCTKNPSSFKNFSESKIDNEKEKFNELFKIIIANKLYREKISVNSEGIQKYINDNFPNNDFSTEDATYINSICSYYAKNSKSKTFTNLSESLGLNFTDETIDSFKTSIGNKIYQNSTSNYRILTGKDLLNLNLSGLDFSNQDLTGYIFTNAKLNGTKFNNAILEGADFIGANLENTNPEDAADFPKSNIEKVKIDSIKEGKIIFENIYVPLRRTNNNDILSRKTLEKIIGYRGEDEPKKAEVADYLIKKFNPESNWEIYRTANYKCAVLENVQAFKRLCNFIINGTRLIDKVNISLLGIQNYLAAKIPSMKFSEDDIKTIVAFCTDRFNSNKSEYPNNLTNFFNVLYGKLDNGQVDIKTLEKELKEIKELIETREIYQKPNSAYRILANKNLSGLDLSGMDFSDQDLTGYIFTDSNLKGANFTNAKLQDTNFTNANLVNAICNGANFSNSKFDNANLNGTEFANSDLSYCKFVNKTSLKKVNLTNANINHADFNNSSLVDAICNYTNFSNSKFNNIKLNKAQLVDVNLSHCKFIDSPITNANVHKQEDIDSSIAKSHNSPSKVDNNQEETSDVTISSPEESEIVTDIEDDIENTSIEKNDVDERFVKLDSISGRSVRNDPSIMKYKNDKEVEKYIIDKINRISGKIKDNDFPKLTKYLTVALRSRYSGENGDPNIRYFDATGERGLIHLTIQGIQTYLGEEFSEEDVKKILALCTHQNTWLSPTFTYTQGLQNVLDGIGAKSKYSRLDLIAIQRLIENGKPYEENIFRVLAGNDLSGLDLSGHMFEGGDLKRIIALRYANLTNATFDKVEYMMGLNMSGSRLVGAKFINTNLTNTILDDCDCKNAKFKEVNLTNATLVNTQLSNCTIENSNLSNAILNNSTGKNIIIENTKFKNTKFQGAKIEEIIFNKSNEFDIAVADYENKVHNELNSIVINVNTILTGKTVDDTDKILRLTNMPPVNNSLTNAEKIISDKIINYRGKTSTEKENTIEDISKKLKTEFQEDKSKIGKENKDNIGELIYNCVVGFKKRYLGKVNITFKGIENYLKNNLLNKIEKRLLTKEEIEILENNKKLSLTEQDFRKHGYKDETLKKLGYNTENNSNTKEFSRKELEDAGLDKNIIKQLGFNCIEDLNFFTKKSLRELNFTEERIKILTVNNTEYSGEDIKKIAALCLTRSKHRSFPLGAQALLAKLGIGHDPQHLKNTAEATEENNKLYQDEFSIHRILANKNLSGLNLSGYDFRNQDLSGYTFAGSNLEGADFTGANLEGTDFTKANLTGTIVKGTRVKPMNLKNSNFSKATITTEFDYVDLSGAIFNGAICNNAIYNNSNLTDVKFIESKLAHSSFINCSYANTDYRNANLEYSVIKNAKLIDKTEDIKENKPDEAKLTKQIIPLINFNGANVDKLTITSEEIDKIKEIFKNIRSISRISTIELYLESEKTKQAISDTNKEAVKPSIDTSVSSQTEKDNGTNSSNSSDNDDVEINEETSKETEIIITTNGEKNAVNTSSQIASNSENSDDKKVDQASEPDEITHDHKEKIELLKSNLSQLKDQLKTMQQEKLAINDQANRLNKKFIELNEVRDHLSALSKSDPNNLETKNNLSLLLKEKSIIRGNRRKNENLKNKIDEKISTIEGQIKNLEQILMEKFHEYIVDSVLDNGKRDYEGTPAISIRVDSNSEKIRDIIDINHSKEDSETSSMKNTTQTKLVNNFSSNNSSLTEDEIEQNNLNVWAKYFSNTGTNISHIGARIISKTGSEYEVTKTNYENNNCLIYAISGGMNNIDSREKFITPENVLAQLKCYDITVVMSQIDVSYPSFDKNLLINYSNLLENYDDNNTNHIKNFNDFCHALSTHINNSKCFLDIQIAATIIAKTLKKNLVFINPNDRKKFSHFDYNIIDDQGEWFTPNDITKDFLKNIESKENTVYIYNHTGDHFEYLRRINKLKQLTIAETNQQADSQLPAATPVKQASMNSSVQQNKPLQLLVKTDSERVYSMDGALTPGQSDKLEKGYALAKAEQQTKRKAAEKEAAEKKAKRKAVEAEREAEREAVKKQLEVDLQKI